MGPQSCIQAEPTEVQGKTKVDEWDQNSSQLDPRECSSFRPILRRQRKRIHSAWHLPQPVPFRLGQEAQETSGSWSPLLHPVAYPWNGICALKESNPQRSQAWKPLFDRAHAAQNRWFRSGSLSFLRWWTQKDCLRHPQLSSPWSAWKY